MQFQPFIIPGFPFMGVKTRDAWNALPFAEKNLLLLAYACDVLKVHEEPKGSNRGLMIDKFAVGARADIGGPWCAEAPTYFLRSIGHDPYPVVKLPASVQSWRDAALEHSAYTDTPKRGCVFVLRSVSHLGVVSGVTGSTVATIEANSNDDGSREGYEMVRHSRNVSSCRFIDLSKLPI